MKVVVDDKIPFIREAIESLVEEVDYIPGSFITSDTVRDADALIIRTRTRCDRKLLEGSRVRFIATATIGFDHIDIDYCREAGIVWRNAPGCNAPSVAQYMQSVLILFAERYRRRLDDLTIGIVGVGNVGSRVAAVAEGLGMKVLLCDPPRAHAEGTAGFVTMDEIVQRSDVITFHVPLYKAGPYKTWHIGDDSFFASLQRHPLIVNTSRGSVISTSSLRTALDKRQICDAVIDVWENEPTIDLSLLRQVWIGTPHIAGYSADGKANATRMSLHALCEFFGLDANFNIEAPLPEHTTIEAQDYHQALLKMYDPRQDSLRLKTEPGKFEWLRGNYPLRREEKAYRVVIA